MDAEEVRRLLKCADAERKKARDAESLLLKMRLESRAILVAIENPPTRIKLFARRVEQWAPELILTRGEENVLYEWLHIYKDAREKAALEYERRATGG